MKEVPEEMSKDKTNTRTAAAKQQYKPGPESTEVIGGLEEEHLLETLAVVRRDEESQYGALGKGRSNMNAAKDYKNTFV